MDMRYPLAIATIIGAFAQELDDEQVDRVIERLYNDASRLRASDSIGDAEAEMIRKMGDGLLQLGRERRAAPSAE